jgi:hypothetical protein
MSSPANSRSLANDLAVVVTEIEANVSHADSITHGLSHAQFNWRTEPGRWSIGECINHLNIINGADLAQLEAVVDAALARGTTGEGPYQYGFFARKFVAWMEPSPTSKKFKAPKQYIPPPEADLAKTIQEYKRVSSELRRIAQKANGLDLLRVKTQLSGIPILRMPLGARLNLLTTHDRRHLWQAEQVRQHPNFPK